MTERPAPCLVHLLYVTLPFLSISHTPGACPFTQILQNLPLPCSTAGRSVSKRTELLTGFASRLLLTAPVCEPARDTPFPWAAQRDFTPRWGQAIHPRTPPQLSSAHLSSPQLTPSTARVCPALRQGQLQGSPGSRRTLWLGRGMQRSLEGLLLLGGCRQGLEDLASLLTGTWRWAPAPRA